MIRSICVLLVSLVLCIPARADDPLVAISGVTDKSTRDSVTIKPRDASGRFEKSITLTVTGTSKISTLGQQVREGKSIFMQKDAEAKDLKSRQPVAAIYSTAKSETVLLSAVESAEGTPLTAISGVLDKVGKDSVTIKPRGAGGKFEKSVTLRVTGTTRVTTLTRQERSGKTVLVQKEVTAKDLKAKQPIAAIYATGKSGPVLLSAVAEPGK